MTSRHAEDPFLARIADVFLQSDLPPLSILLSRRVDELVEAKVATRREFDRTASSDRVTEADVDAAEQRLRDAEIELTHGEIRSPASGRVERRLVTMGRRDGTARVEVLSGLAAGEQVRLRMEGER